MTRPPQPESRADDPIFVIGHRNPDTDTVMSAIGYAWLLRERDKLNTIAARAGQVNLQTAFALERFGLEAPRLLSDASARFSVIARPIEGLPPESPLRDAWALIARTGLAAPIVRPDGTPLGLATGASLFKYLTRHLGDTLAAGQVTLAELPFGQVLDMPCGDAADPHTPHLEADERISDVLPRILRQECFEYLVTEHGRYLGVCHKSDMLHPPRMKLILIDHNEAGQAISGLAEAELLEVLDHHRLANPPTHMPIAFHVDPVGSSSTLVAERAMRAGLAAPRSIAGALLSGLLSDTLVLRSPTTTDRDRVAAVQLAAWAFADAGPGDPYQAMQEYGWQLLQAGIGPQTRTPDEMIGGDYKEYEAVGLRFGIAQVEVADMLEIETRLSEIRQALERHSAARGLDLTALMVTDIVRGNSRLICHDPAYHLSALPYARRPDDTLDLPGIVSRKKQLLPAILDALRG